jgi:ribonuclease P protein component
VRTTQLEVRYLASPLHRARVGVIVPKHGRSSVERNKVKRRLRELARTELLPRLGAMDVVIRATPGAYAATFDLLRAALLKAASQLLPKDGGATA